MDTKGLCIYLQWPFFLSGDKEKSPHTQGEAPNESIPTE